MRLKAGLPGLAIAWGPIAYVGYVAEKDYLVLAHKGSVWLQALLYGGHLSSGLYATFFAGQKIIIVTYSKIRDPKSGLLPQVQALAAFVKWLPTKLEHSEGHEVVSNNSRMCLRR